jgi:CubicO group peptidase (beta-lactamase class C family)
MQSDYVSRASNGGPGGVIYRKTATGETALCYGTADLQQHIPVTENTSFHVASLAKQFTAFLALELIEAGRLGEQADIREYLNGFIADFPIRVTHLIHHTSGLQDQWVLGSLAGLRPGDAISTEDVLRWIKGSQHLNFEPGTRFMYSNTGYTLLAQIISTIVGRPFSEYAKEKLFRPLSMMNTFFVESPDQLIENRAIGYIRNDHSDVGYALRDPRLGVIGSTCLRTTLADMKQWSAALGPTGYFPDQLLRRFAQPGILDDQSPITYGFGQIALSHCGRDFMFHGGFDYGFNAAFARTTDGILSVFAASNGSFARLETTVLSMLKADVEGATAPNASVRPRSAALRAPAERSIADGVFASEDLSDVRVIKMEAERYKLDWMQGFDLDPVEGNKYLIAGTTGHLWLECDSSGTALIVESPETTIRLRKVERSQNLQFEEYLGCYLNSSLGSALWIEGTDAGVSLRVGNAIPEPINILREDLITWRGYWAIVSRSDNKIRSIDVCHPRCLRVVFEKVS